MSDLLFHAKLSARKSNSLGIFEPISTTVRAASLKRAQDAAIKDLGLAGFEVHHIIEIWECPQ